MKTNALALAGLLCLAAAVAQAQDAFSLVRKATVGDATVYVVKMDMDMGGTKVNVTGMVTETVTKIDENGDITVTSKYTETKAKVKGAESEITQEDDVVVYKKTGEVARIIGKAVDASMVRLANMLSVKVSGKPVTIGSTWTDDVPADAKSGAVVATGEYKVTSREKIGVYDCLVVSVKYRENGDKGATCDTNLWIDVAKGVLVKREALIKNLPTSFANVKQPTNATLSVVIYQPAPPKPADATPPVKNG